MFALSNITKPIINGCKTVAKSSSDYCKVAQRAAQIKGVSPARTNVAKAKASVVGAFRPVIKTVKENSDSFDTVINTLGHIKRKGFKQAKPTIQEALKNISGINDIKMATKEKGVIRGIAETGKAITRLASTLGLFVAGNFVPVPGASVVGWVAGEKITEKCLGKPFTKQMQKIIR